MDGQQTPLEMHAVHEAEAGQGFDGKLLVVAFMLEENTNKKEHDNFYIFVNKVPVRKTAVPALIYKTFEFNKTIAASRIYGFWEYVGSLTTPPCSGGVQVY